MTPNEHLEREALIAAIDAALDWADANARAFTIETAPKNGDFFLAWVNDKDKYTTHRWWILAYWSKNAQRFFDDQHNEIYFERLINWRPLPPPPSNPPLPEPLERLGEVVRKIKGADRG